MRMPARCLRNDGDVVVLRADELLTLQVTTMLTHCSTALKELRRNSSSLLRLSTCMKPNTMEKPFILSVCPTRQSEHLNLSFALVNPINIIY